MVGNQSGFALQRFTLAHLSIGADGSVVPGSTIDSALAGDSNEMQIYTGTGPAQVIPLAAYVCCSIGDTLIESYAINSSGPLEQQGPGLGLATQAPTCLAVANLANRDHAMYVGTLPPTPWLPGMFPIFTSIPTEPRVRLSIT